MESPSGGRDCRPRRARRRVVPVRRGLELPPRRARRSGRPERHQRRTQRIDRDGHGVCVVALVTVSLAGARNAPMPVRSRARAPGAPTGLRPRTRPWSVRRRSVSAGALRRARFGGALFRDRRPLTNEVMQRQVRDPASRRVGRCAAPTTHHATAADRGFPRGGTRGRAVSVGADRSAGHRVALAAFGMQMRAGPQRPVRVTSIPPMT